MSLSSSLPRLKWIPPNLMNEIAKQGNAHIVYQYYQEMIHEGLAEGYYWNACFWVAKIAAHSVKPFKEITRQDILAFLNTLRVSEDKVPLHHWIGTYNLVRIHICRFIRWLYYPELTSRERQKLDPNKKPEAIQNIPTVRRKEKEVYESGDMWTQEQIALFLKYSKSARDRAYVMMAFDSSARPAEMLRLRIKDIEDVSTPTGKHYLQFIARGKTGKRPLVLFDSTPYVKEWILSHPQNGNPEGILFCSVKQRQMSTMALGKIFSRYKTEHFPALLNTNIPEEDKQKIRDFLKKPFNPYVIRHTALTDKSSRLKEPELRQHAGHTPGYQSIRRYTHLRGDESNKTLLIDAGILPKVEQEKNILRSKDCPECFKPNQPDARFCWNCRRILSYKGYAEVLEAEKKKDQEMQALRNEILEIKAAQQKKEDKMQEQIEEIRGLYEGLNKTLDEVADLRAKIRANPQEFLEADPFKFVANQKKLTLNVNQD